MLKEGFLLLSQSGIARRLATHAPLARSMARRFVAGETVDDVLYVTRLLNRQGLKVTIDYLGEAVRNREEARKAADVYLDVLDRIESSRVDANISLKLTQMGQDIGESFLRANVGRILDRARELDIFVRFDMESTAYTQRTLDFFRSVWSEGYDDVGVVIQSYLRRAEADVSALIELGARVRLCKGAYAEPEDVAFPDKEAVDANFIHLMRRLLAEANYPAIATHDERMIRATRAFAEDRGIEPASFEFQMLYGVRRDVQQQLVDDGYNVRVYVPFGAAWYPYLMRRLAERPANVVFVADAILRESPLRRLLPGR